MISKKIGVSSLVLVCTLSVFPVIAEASVPAKSGFILGMEGDWLQQNSYNANFETILTNAPNFASNNTPDGPQILPPVHYAFSGGGVVGYLFKNDVDLSFSFLINNQSSTTVTTPGVGQGLYDDSVAGKYVSNATTQLSTRTNLYSAMVGQWRSFTDDVTIHPFVGLSVADLMYSDTITYRGYKVLVSGVPSVDPNSIGTVTDATSSTGVGPVFGADGQYNFHHRFSLIWQASLAALAGEQDISGPSYYNIPLIRSSFTLNVPIKENLHIYGLLQARLGINYELPIKSVPVELSGGFRVIKTISYIAGQLNNSSQPNDCMGPYISLSATI